MTIEHLKPTLPDYLVEAVNEAYAAMQENGNIHFTRRDVEASLETTEQAIADMEAQLGDLEAEALLRRKPDSAKAAKLQEKLEGLRVEQRKLTATGKSLELREQQHDEKVVRAFANLNSARRKLGFSLLVTLNNALVDAVQPLQDVLDVVGAVNDFVDFGEYSYPRMEAVVRCFGGDRHLIALGINYTPEGLPRETCKDAMRWKEALACAKQVMSDLLPISEDCRRAIEHRQEKAAEERMRQERLKPRIV